MKKLRRSILFVVFSLFLLSITSCGSNTLLRTYEVVDQAYRANAKGTYLGTASSYDGARRLAANKGFTRFEWYSKTGDVFGFNN